MGKKLKKKPSLLFWLKTSVYTFPLILLVILVLLTVFRINGSSTGIYYSLTNGPKTSGPQLLFGKPRPIRSDEWLTTSPLTALQAKTGFPQFNNDLGSGRDVVISPDAPTKNWVTIFRPQNWSFFLMPFEYAFAFRWWFGLFLLIVSAYFFLMRLLDKNKTLSILLSVAFGLSPFLLWWYQSDLFVTMAYSFMMMIIAIRIIGREKLPKLKSQRLANVFYALALGYIGTSFVLFLYAPFLISLFIVVAAFAVGYLLNELLTKRSITRKQALRNVGWMLAPIIIIAPLVFLFAVQNKDMIRAIADSKYPGQRVVHSGELPFSRIYRFSDGFVMPLLQHPPTGQLYANQSEAADFILLLPFLLIPGILLQVYDYRKNKRVDWLFLLIQLLAIVFILRITVPAGDVFYKLLLLNRVPNNRLMAGVGLLGFLQLVYFIKYSQAVKAPRRKVLIGAAAFSLLTLIWLVIFSGYIFHQYLVFKYNWLIVGCLILFFTAIIFAFLSRQKTLGAVLLLAFTLVSGYKILPIQRGLPFFEDSEVVNKIEQDSGPNDSWAVVDDFTFETLPWMAGRKMVSGPQIYPDLNFWRQLDKSGQFEDIYNREAHALFISDTAVPDAFLPKNFAEKMNQRLELVKGNVFKVRFTCSDFIYKNVNFVLTTHQLNLPCTVPVDQASYPKVTFYIYKIKPAD